MRAIQTSARCGASWISLFIVTGLSLVEEVVRVEADVRVVAVVIVQPYNVVDYPTRLLTTYLAQPAIQCYPVVNVGLPCSLPRFASVELFLGQHSPQSCGLLIPAHPPRQRLLYRRKRKRPGSPPSPLRYHYSNIMCTILSDVLLPSREGVHQLHQVHHKIIIPPNIE